MGSGSDQDDAAVLDVGSQQVPIGQEHGVIGIPKLVRPGSRRTCNPVPPDDAPGRDVDDADDEIVLFGRDDLAAIGGEEGIIGNQKRLARSKVTRLRKPPENATLRVDDQEPVISLVRDQDRPW